MQRADVERAIRGEDAMLQVIVRLIRGGVSLSEWPADARRTLLAALCAPGAGQVEVGKAQALWLHLFGPAEPDFTSQTEEAPDEQTERNAERIRADLAAKVKLRAGLALLR